MPVVFPWRLQPEDKDQAEDAAALESLALLYAFAEHRNNGLAAMELSIFGRMCAILADSAVPVPVSEVAKVALGIMSCTAEELALFDADNIKHVSNREARVVLRNMDGVLHDLCDQVANAVAAGASAESEKEEVSQND